MLLRYDDYFLACLKQYPDQGSTVVMISQASGQQTPPPSAGITFPTSQNDMFCPTLMVVYRYYFIYIYVLTAYSLL